MKHVATLLLAATRSRGRSRINFLSPSLSPPRFFVWGAWVPSSLVPLDCLVSLNGVVPFCIRLLAACSSEASSPITFSSFSQISCLLVARGGVESAAASAVTVKIEIEIKTVCRIRIHDF